MTLLSVIVAVLVLSALAYVLMRTQAGKQKRTFNAKALGEKLKFSDRPDLNIGLIQSKWAEVEAMQSSGPSGLKNAIIEADKLLDYVLRAKGFKGETMADRMKAAGPQMGNVTAVWAAHKLRNMVAHEVEHDIVAEQVKHAVNDLAQAIRTLGVPLQ